MASLRLLRESRNLSQRALAKKAGISFRSLQLVESGRHNPRWSTLAKIGRALGVDGASLVKGSASPYRTDETLREYSLKIAQDGSESWKGHLMEFVDGFRKRPDQVLISDAPVAAVGPRVLALIGATVETLCAERGIPSPWWSKAVPVLAEPWFVAGSESLKASALVESPAQFRQRNIFVLENFLTRA